MIIVADAGPLQYLVRIGAIDVLSPLYDRVLVPHSVARELQHNEHTCCGPELDCAAARLV